MDQSLLCIRRELTVSENISRPVIPAGFLDVS